MAGSGAGAGGSRSPNLEVDVVKDTPDLEVEDVPPLEGIVSSAAA